MADDEVQPEFTISELDQEVAKRHQHELMERFLHESVQREEMSPVEAERYAAGIDLPLEGQDWPVSFSDPHWPLVYAVLWIAWRNASRTAREWDRFRVFAGHIWRDPLQDHQLMTLEQAEEVLWQALKSGSVHAQGLPHDEADAAEIPSVHWLNLEWMPNCKKISLRNFGHPEPRYRVVTVNSHEVLAKWPENVAATSTAQHSASERSAVNSGGAPIKYDWDAMWIEVVRLADAGLIHSRAGLTDHIHAWFSATYGHEPAPSSVRTRMSKLFETLQWDQKIKG